MHEEWSVTTRTKPTERRNMSSLSEPISVSMWLNGVYYTTMATSLRQAVNAFAYKLSGGHKYGINDAYRRMATEQFVLQVTSPEVATFRIEEHRKAIRTLHDLVSEEGRAPSKAFQKEIADRTEQIKMLESMLEGFDYTVNRRLSPRNE